MRTVSTLQKRVDIRREDNVKVIAGRDKGKEGRVLRVFPNDNKLLVEHVMMVKKRVRQESAAQIQAASRNRKAGSPCPMFNWFVGPVGRCGSGTKYAAIRKSGYARSAELRWISELLGEAFEPRGVHPERSEGSGEYSKYLDSRTGNHSETVGGR